MSLRTPTAGEMRIHDAVAVKKVTSSTDATPIVITSTAHLLVTGDRITLTGHTTNTNANGTWVVTRTGANSFSLDDSTATGGGAGGATGVFAKGGVVALQVEDWRHIILTYFTDGGGTADMTLKLVGSQSKTNPDFAAAQSPTNRWFYIAQKEIDDGTTIVTGSTGIAAGGADINAAYEANIDGIRWLYLLPTASTASAGTITVDALPYNNS